MSEPWSHNIHYHRFVLAAMPPGCRNALEVGCGDGLLARKLALRCDAVTGLDADPAILQAASSRPTPETLKFVEGDAMTYPFPAASFDFITAVATVHHLPLTGALLRFRALLAPAGALAVVGLYRIHDFSDYLAAVTALPVSRMMKLTRNVVTQQAAMLPPRETLDEIRSAAHTHLPGSVLTRRLFFRYTLLWRNPSQE